MRSFCLFFNLAMMIGFSATVCTAQEKTGEWTHWRGPRWDGVSLEKEWNPRFDDKGPKMLWEARIGRGFSAPVIREQRLYLSATDPNTLQREIVYCLDSTTGKEIWKHDYEITSLQRTGNPSGGTPALVGEFVYSYGAAMTLVCLRADSGKVVWSKDLMKELPGKPSPYGFQLSPIPHEDTIIVPAIGSLKAKPDARIVEPKGGPYSDTGGMLLAFDRKTGAEVWRNTEGASAWSSPILAELGGKMTLLHQTGRHLLGINPADGKTRWKVDLRDVGIHAEDMAASPVVYGDIIVTPVHKAFGVTNNGTAGSAAYRIENGEPKLLWKNTQWCHWFQSPAIWGDYVYGYDERSTFWCFDVKTGKEQWRTKELGATGKGGGALTVADGKMLAIDARQNLIIAELSPKGHQLLGKATIFSAESGFECETAPLLLDGRLYCRNHTQLICFDLREVKPK